MVDKSFNPGATVAMLRNSIVIPAFSYDQAFVDASLIVAEWEIGNENWIGLKLPVVIDNETCVFAVRYVVEEGIVVRYLLNPLDSMVLFFPTYNGQKLGPSAVIEIWTIADSDGAQVQETDLTIPLTGLAAINSCGWCCPSSSPTSAMLSPTTPITFDVGSGGNPFSEVYQIP